MKYIVLALLFLVVFTACEKDKNNPNYIIVNGIKSGLNYAFIEDYGTDEFDITYRKFAVQLQDDYADSSFYIKFLVYSFETNNELSLGDYYYNFNGGRGTFSFLKTGAGLRYDSFGDAISGFVYYDWFLSDTVLDGTLNIGVNRKNTIIELNATMLRNNDTISIEAYYDDKLAQTRAINFEEVYY